MKQDTLFDTFEKVTCILTFLDPREDEPKHLDSCIFVIQNHEKYFLEKQCLSGYYFKNKKPGATLGWFYVGNEINQNKARFPVDKETPHAVIAYARVPKIPTCYEK